MSSDFRLLMLGAMYENGGNVTHRLLDGHPQLFVYPFESQLGTDLVQDQLRSVFPTKYRWPEFALDATPAQDFHAMIDEECKVRARTPHVSKFRHVPFDFSDDERARCYAGHVAASGRSRGDNVAAFFRSTFEVWRDHRRSGDEEVYVGYSPVVGVDAEKILADLPGAHLLHVVRNPWSAYADTKKRPVPLGLDAYVLGWAINQYHALLARRRHPERVHIVRLEDVLADPLFTLGGVCERIGVERSATLSSLSWNGTALNEAYPWGTLRRASTAENVATAGLLSAAEKDRISEATWQYLDELDYRGFLGRTP